MFKIAILGIALSLSLLSSPCTMGTVTSYESGTCTFGPATVQILNYSDTFGITADQTNVNIVNYGTPSNPFYYLDIEPQAGSWGQYNSGTGSTTVTMQWTFPAGSYSMEFYLTNGCCDVGGEGFSAYPGGVMTETITGNTTALIPDGPATYADESVTSSYSSSWGSNSTNYTGETSGPLEFFEFSQPTSGTTPPTSTPEPASMLFCSVGLVYFTWALRSSSKKS